MLTNWSTNDDICILFEEVKNKHKQTHLLEHQNPKSVISKRFKYS